MQIYSAVTPCDRFERHPRAVALGLFDGIHLGHRRVIGTTVGFVDAASCVLTFEGASALKPHASALCSEAETARLLETLGADEWMRCDFETIRHLSPEAFVREVLVEQLGATHVCCGFNFRFGKGGVGDAALLTELGARYGFEVHVTDATCDGGETISSKRIRSLIEQGNLREATRLLGHPFVIDTEVCHGQALGRTLAFPTINQLLPPFFVQPRYGVYTSTVVLDGRTYRGITNVGCRPTVGGTFPTVETWIDGFDGDLYGRSPRVMLTSFLRDERKFDAVDALKAQIAADRDAAHAALDADGTRAILFDFDDTLQNRPAAFRRYMTYFLQTYLPSRLGDEEAYREAVRLNNSGYVDYLQFFTAMPGALGVPNPPTAEALFKEYQRVFPTFVHLFDGARETLEALRAEGFRLGIVTNGPLVQQHRKIDVSGLRPLLDTVVVSSEEGVAKPNAELFLRAAARLNVSPKQCLFVGDHPQNDIAGAVNAGMRAVFLDTRLPSCERDDVPTLHSVRALLEYLKKEDILS